MVVMEFDRVYPDPLDKVHPEALVLNNNIFDNRYHFTRFRR
jgi:hypothetical protein